MDRDLKAGDVSIVPLAHILAQRQSGGSQTIGGLPVAHVTCVVRVLTVNYRSHKEDQEDMDVDALMHSYQEGSRA